jgi:elongation factor 1-gamma
LNAHLQGKSFLVAERLTVADLVSAVSLLLPFQTVLDAGFRKSVAPNVAAWLDRVLTTPEVVRRMGHVKLCQKALKPVAPAKKEEAKPAAKPQAKPAADGEEAEKPKKVVDPLDALPPSKLDLPVFKTYFVNLPDKRGEGMKHFFDIYDNEGYCLYYAKYDKAEGEGTVSYQFANLLNGFLQRLDDFRRHCFGSVIMTGEEPNLDIESVWLFRGKTIPARMDEHPQWEYFTTRKLDENNEADRQLITDFWSAKSGELVQGK